MQEILVLLHRLLRPRRIAPQTAVRRLAPRSNTTPHLAAVVVQAIVMPETMEAAHRRRPPQLSAVMHINIVLRHLPLRRPHMRRC